MIQEEPTCTISVAASAFSAGVVLCTYRHSSNGGAAIGTVPVFASVEWMLIYTPELTVSLLYTIVWAYREFATIVLISTMWLGFAFYYADCEKKNSISGQKQKGSISHRIGEKKQQFGKEG